MFEGRAEEAMSFYVSLFDDGAITRIERAEHGVHQAEVTLNGQAILAIDSPVKHAFTFTPAMSLFVTCDDEAQLDRLYGALIEGGVPLMALGDYGFSKKFGWLNDRFGVSWQLNLP
jgi:predicted 3-demethylubiquinone-9 3-methyltransferase (glyoxalase superfamily)